MLMKVSVKATRGSVGGSQTTPARSNQFQHSWIKHCGSELQRETVETHVQSRVRIWILRRFSLTPLVLTRLCRRADPVECLFVSHLSLGGDGAKSPDASAAAVVYWPGDDPTGMNNAWVPATDYPYQYAIVITLPKLPLNSYECVHNVWDPYRTTAFNFLPGITLTNSFKRASSCSLLEVTSLCLCPLRKPVEPRPARGLSEASPLAAGWLDRRE